MMTKTDEWPSSCLARASNRVVNVKTVCRLWPQLRHVRPRKSRGMWLACFSSVGMLVSHDWQITQITLITRQADHGSLEPLNSSFTAANCQWEMRPLPGQENAKDRNRRPRVTNKDTTRERKEGEGARRRRRREREREKETKKNDIWSISLSREQRIRRYSKYSFKEVPDH